MNVSCKELRSRAWDKLSGNLGGALGAYIVSSLLMSAGGIFTFGAMNYGLANYFLDLQRGQDKEFTSIFEGFNNYGDTLLTGLLQSIFLALWSLLFLIPGIIKSFSYSMVYYVMIDFNLSGEEAITKSRELMNGHKFQLFLLHLSFFGWILLGMITFGIGMFFVAPYMKAAEAEFYTELVKDCRFDNAKQQA